MRKKSKKINIFKEQMKCMGNEVYDALKNKEYIRLEELQTFALAVSLWNMTNMPIAYISFFVKETVNKKIQSKNLKAKFSEHEINKIIKRMAETKEFTIFLENLGLIDKEYNEENKEEMFSLNDCWKGTIQKIIDKKEETDVFCQSIGSLLALSYYANKESGNCGEKLFKSLVVICMEAINHNGDVSEDFVKNTFSSDGKLLRKYYQLDSVNSSMNKKIKFFEKSYGKMITISQSALNGYTHIQKRANEIIRKKIRSKK